MGDFCIYVHQGYWPIIFFFCNVFVWFCYQGDASLVKWVGSLPSSPGFQNSLKRMDGWMVFNIHLWSLPVQDFLLLEIFFYYIFGLLVIISLFIFLVSSWFSPGKFYVSRNLSISSRLSNLLAYSCSWYFLTDLCILWCQLYFPSFISDFNYLGPLPFFLDESGERFVNLVYLLKEPGLGFIGILYCFFLMLFSLFLLWSLFFPSTLFELCVLFIFIFLLV